MVSTRCFVTGCLLTFAATMAQASIIYNFSGIGGGLVGGVPVPETFVYTSPGFIPNPIPPMDTDVPVANLTSCTIAGSACQDVLFSPTGTGGPVGDVSIRINYTNQNADLFYFPLGSLSATGTYMEIFAFHPATLTVTNTATTVTPEPSAFVPFGLMGIWYGIRRLRTSRVKRS